MASRIPVLRILGGLLFILAGLAYYLGVTVASSAGLLFIVAGAVVVLLAAFGHRARAGDVAIFVVGLLVLGVFISPGVGLGPSGSERISHDAAKGTVSAHQIDLLVSTDVGSITVAYSSRSDLAYQVNFTRSSFPFLLWPGASPLASLTNETRGGEFVLNATARSYDVSVAIARGYFLNVSASTGTGNVNLNGLSTEALGAVSLQSGTGSVNGNFTSKSIGSVRLETGTGSVSLFSNHFSPNGARVPVSLTTGTGSVSLKMMLPSGTAVSLTASAGFGSVSHDLNGFLVNQQSSTGSNLVATAGDMNTAAASFVIQMSTGTGSVSVSSQFLG
jgi:hypothetical protein